MFFVIVPWRDINIENFVLRQSNLPFWVSVKLSNTLKTQIKQDKQSICVTLQERKKNEARPIIFYMVYLIIVNMIFSESIDAFVLVSAKFKCQIMRQDIFDTTNIGIYYAVTISKSEKKKDLIQFQFFRYKRD